MRHLQMKDLAQACLAFLGDPTDASDRARAIFNDDKVYERVFPKRVQALQLLLPYTIYMEADKYTRPASSTDSWVSYLRYPLVYCISRITHELAGDESLEYFTARQSDTLSTTIAAWCPDLLAAAFDELKKHILQLQAREAGLGARTIVRRRDWFLEPYDRFRERIRIQLRTEGDIAKRQGESANDLGLRAAFPFPVRGFN
jgi:hypothetical protein